MCSLARSTIGGELAEQVEADAFATGADAFARAERDQPIAADLDARIARAVALTETLAEVRGLLADGNLVQHIVSKKQRALLGFASELLSSTTRGRYGFSEDFEDAHLPSACGRARRGPGWSSIFGRMGRGRDVRITTLYDLYAIDEEGLGVTEALSSATQATQKVKLAEDAMRRGVSDDRFVAHVSLYELESLIFADLEQVIAVHPDWRTEIEELGRRVHGLEPEAIHDRRETSPSHRLRQATAERYNKVVDGPSILKRIGLPALRAACPHFASWLGAMEELGVNR